MTEIQMHAMDDGRRIAFHHTKGTGPTLVFLPGYMSDMSGSKATALFENARSEGRGCLLLDYSGCGQSDGDFANGTLSRWCDEVVAVINAHVDGEILLVGSSMGGWLMLLVAERLPDRLDGMIGIAAAPDFTQWGYTQEQRELLASGETVLEENPYGPEPTPTHPGFFADAEANLRLDGRELVVDCPVRLLHGMLDEEVPWETSLKILAAARSENIQVTFVKDGDHRLSRIDDIALLSQVVESFY